MNTAITSTVIVAPGPAATVPGSLVVTQSTGAGAALRLRHAEWLYEQGVSSAGALSRVLWALTPEVTDRTDPTTGRPLADPRRYQGRSSTRVVLITNYWTTGREALRKAGLTVNGAYRVVPGTAQPDPGEETAGRLFLIDRLRDLLPRVNLVLPPEPMDEHPDVIDRHTLRSAMGAVQARPRTVDEATDAAVLDRHELLILAVALGVHDVGSRASGFASRAPRQGLQRVGR